MKFQNRTLPCNSGNPELPNGRNQIGKNGDDVYSHNSSTSRHQYPPRFWTSPPISVYSSTYSSARLLLKILTSSQQSISLPRSERCIPVNDDPALFEIHVMNPFRHIWDQAISFGFHHHDVVCTGFQHMIDGTQTLALKIENSQTLKLKPIKLSIVRWTQPLRFYSYL